MIRVVPIPAFNDNYIWAIVNKEIKKAIIVDPGDNNPVEKFLDKHRLSLSAILITHHHHDHVGGIMPLKKEDIPVYGPDNIKITDITSPIHDGNSIYIEDYKLNFKIIHVPGHTKDHIVYFSQDMLFCGDTLFSGGCGRLFEGTPEEMLNSLEKLKSLPTNMRIYPAHEYTLSNLEFAKAVEPDNEYIDARIEECRNLRKRNLPTLPSTMEIELNTNPFLRFNDTLLRTASLFEKRTLTSKLDLFTTLRKMKDQW